jgi:hypothetical protein
MGSSVVGRKLSRPIDVPDPAAPEAIGAFERFAAAIPDGVPSGLLAHLYAALARLAHTQGLPRHRQRHAAGELSSAVNALLAERPELAPSWLACREHLRG